MDTADSLLHDIARAPAAQLAPGAAVGPYQVVAPLRSGGMGEVYRARDPRLGREVALKIVRAARAGSPELRDRFLREARAVAALSHPNVLAIHDVGFHEGVPYLVSELLEGEDLRQALKGGPIPLRKAREWALQIARGLAAAHDKGIVHRDLKPANVFITQDGLAKILDFGLAKLLHPDGSRSEAESADPSTPSSTEDGRVMGTAGYMSPEQARGEAVDHRSDIFSFGVVLYEMLTGRRPFARGSVPETLTATMREDPPPLGTPECPLPDSLERVVLHCLEKDPRDRFQSARDLAFNLTIPPLPPARSRRDPPRTQRSRSLRALAWLVLLGAAGALGAVLDSYLGGKALQAPAPAEPEYRRLTFRKGQVAAARFAPSGDTILYSAFWAGSPVDVFSTNPERPESRALGIGGVLLSVSRTGELAVRLRSRFEEGYCWIGVLARVPLSGGAPREMLEDVHDADWAPDGQTLAIIRQVGGRHRIEYPIGRVLYDTGGWVSHLRVSPDGTRVAFIDHPLYADDRGAAAGRTRTLSATYATAFGLAWAPSGREVWFTATSTGSNRALYAVPLRGKERLVARFPAMMTLMDIAPDGRVLFTAARIRRQIIGLLPGASQERDFSWLDYSRLEDLSPDGRRILFYESGEGGGPGYSVYLRSVDAAAPVRLGSGTAASLSPDGRWAVSIPLQKPRRLVLLPTGAGSSHAVPRSGVEPYTARWFPDGRRLLVAGREQGHRPRLYEVDLRTGKPRPVTPEGVSEKPVVSPDGTRVATARADARLWIYPVAGGPGRPVQGALRGEIPAAWSEDGTALFVYRAGQTAVIVHRLDLRTGKRTRHRRIAPPALAAGGTIRTLLLTPDGRWHAYAYLRVLSDLYLARDWK